MDACFHILCDVITVTSNGAAHVIIGTLSKDDDDDRENLDKKMSLPSFKLNRVYLDSLNLSNAGDFSWS